MIIINRMYSTKIIRYRRSLDLDSENLESLLFDSLLCNLIRRIERLEIKAGYLTSYREQIGHPGIVVDKVIYIEDVLYEHLSYLTWMLNKLFHYYNIGLVLPSSYFFLLYKENRSREDTIRLVEIEFSLRSELKEFSNSKLLWDFCSTHLEIEFDPYIFYYLGVRSHIVDNKWLLHMRGEFKFGDKDRLGEDWGSFPENESKDLKEFRGEVCKRLFGKLERSLGNSWHFSLGDGFNFKIHDPLISGNFFFSSHHSAEWFRLLEKYCEKIKGRSRSRADFDVRHILYSPPSVLRFLLFRRKVVLRYFLILWTVLLRRVPILQYILGTVEEEDRMPRMDTGWVDWKITQSSWRLTFEDIGPNVPIAYSWNRRIIKVTGISLCYPVINGLDLKERRILPILMLITWLDSLKESCFVIECEVKVEIKGKDFYESYTYSYSFNAFFFDKLFDHFYLLPDDIVLKVTVIYKVVLNKDDIVSFVFNKDPILKEVEDFELDRGQDTERVSKYFLDLVNNLPDNLYIEDYGFSFNLSWLNEGFLESDHLSKYFENLWEKKNEEGYKGEEGSYYKNYWWSKDTSKDWQRVLINMGMPSLYSYHMARDPLKWYGSRKLVSFMGINRAITKDMDYYIESNIVKSALQDYVEDLPVPYNCLKEMDKEKEFKLDDFSYTLIREAVALDNKARQDLVSIVRELEREWSVKYKGDFGTQRLIPLIEINKMLVGRGEFSIFKQLVLQKFGRVIFGDLFSNLVKGIDSLDNVPSDNYGSLLRLKYLLSEDERRTVKFDLKIRSSITSDDFIEEWLDKMALFYIGLWEKESMSYINSYDLLKQRRQFHIIKKYFLDSGYVLDNLLKDYQESGEYYEERFESYLYRHIRGLPYMVIRKEYDYKEFKSGLLEEPWKVLVINPMKHVVLERRMNWYKKYITYLERIKYKREKGGEDE